MPYDHAKGHELRKTALAYAHTVMGEFIGQLAQQLLDAEAEIKTLTNGTADTRAEVEEASRRLMMESQAHRTTKEKLTAEIAALGVQKQELMGALSDITLDARGAKKIAADVLTKITAPEVKS